MSIYLDFEEPIQAIEEQIEKTKEIGQSTEVDMSDKIQELELKLKNKTKEIFSNLTPGSVFSYQDILKGPIH